MRCLYCKGELPEEQKFAHMHVKSCQQIYEEQHPEVLKLSNNDTHSNNNSPNNNRNNNSNSSSPTNNSNSTETPEPAKKESKKGVPQAPTTKPQCSFCHKLASRQDCIIFGIGDKVWRSCDQEHFLGVASIKDQFKKELGEELKNLKAVHNDQFRESEATPCALAGCTHKKCTDMIWFTSGKGEQVQSWKRWYCCSVDHLWIYLSAITVSFWSKLHVQWQKHEEKQKEKQEAKVKKPKVAPKLKEKKPGKPTKAGDNEDEEDEEDEEKEEKAGKARRRLVSKKLYDGFVSGDTSDIN